MHCLQNVVARILCLQVSYIHVQDVHPFCRQDNNINSFGVPFPHSSLSMFKMFIHYINRMEFKFHECTFPSLLSLFVQDVHPLYRQDDRLIFFSVPFPNSCLSISGICISSIWTGWQPKLFQCAFPSLLCPYVPNVQCTLYILQIYLQDARLS